MSTLDPGSREFFGRGNQTFTSPRALVSAELFKGQTAFRPKSFAIKGTAAFDLNYLRVGERNLVDIDVREGRTRRRQDFSLEEAFAEAKLADLSPQFDFVSLRAGIQPSPRRAGSSGRRRPCPLWRSSWAGTPSGP
ncbi:MAG: hypothetical protein DMF81_11470 [Acidobacteria bacterium]|nr:MAG: hypothetical protein DMF81_11470 [Acidobacteriota bacterium]